MHMMITDTNRLKKACIIHVLHLAKEAMYSLDGFKIRHKLSLTAYEMLKAILSGLISSFSSFFFFLLNT